MESGIAIARHLVKRGEIAPDNDLAVALEADGKDGGIGAQPRIESLVDDMSRAQTDRVAALAKRVNAGLTAEDLRNPQDFPELAADPDFNYQDGLLAGIDSVRMALRALLKEVC